MISWSRFDTWKNRKYAAQDGSGDAVPQESNNINSPASESSTPDIATDNKYAADLIYPYLQAKGDDISEASVINALQNIPQLTAGSNSVFQDAGILEGRSIRDIQEILEHLTEINDRVGGNTSQNSNKSNESNNSSITLTDINNRKSELENAEKDLNNQFEKESDTSKKPQDNEEGEQPSNETYFKSGSTDNQNVENPAGANTSPVEVKKLTPDKNLNDIKHQEKDELDIKRGSAVPKETSSPNPAQSSNTGEPITDSPITPNSEYDDVTGKNTQEPGGKGLQTIENANTISKASTPLTPEQQAEQELQAAGSPSNAQRNIQDKDLNDAATEGTRQYYNDPLYRRPLNELGDNEVGSKLDIDGSKGIRYTKDNDGKRVFLDSEDGTPRYGANSPQAYNPDTNTVDLSQKPPTPKGFTPIENVPGEELSSASKRLQDRLESRKIRQPESDFDPSKYHRPGVKPEQILGANKNVEDKKQADNLRKQGLQNIQQQAQEKAKQVAKETAQKALSTAGKAASRLAAPVAQAITSAVSGVITALAPYILPIIAAFAILVLVTSIFTAVIVYSYCKPIEQIRAVLEASQGYYLSAAADAANSIPLIGGGVASIGGLLAEKSPLYKYLEESGICKTINPDYCGGSGGGAVKGDGSVDVGNGIDNIPCLVIERTGKYADPHLRAFARAIGSCGIEAPCGSIQQHYGEANSIGYFGRYQWGVGLQGTPDSWQDYVSSSGNSGGVPRATEMYNQSKSGSRTAWRAQDKVFMDCVSGNGGFKCPFGGMMDALKSGDDAKAQSIMRANINNWEAMGTKSDQIVARYKKLLPEEQSGTCGKGSQDLPKPPSDVAILNILTRLGSVDGYAQTSSITSLSKQQRRELLMKLHDEGKWNMQTKSERSYWLSSGPQNKVDLMLAIIHPSLGNMFIETGSDSWIHGSHADGTAVDIVRIGARGKGDPGEAGFLAAVDKGPYRRTAFMDANILQLVSIAAGTGVVRQGALYGPEVLVNQSAYQGKMWWYPGHNDHLHISVVGDNQKTASLNGVPASSAQGSKSGGECAEACIQTTASITNNQASFIDIFTGSIQVNAAFGNNPGTDYNALPDGHKQFLDEVAKEKGYTKYSDATKFSPDAQKGLDAWFAQGSKDGFPLSTVSTYRSFNDQMSTFFSKISKFWSPDLSETEKQTVKASYLERAKLSAPPGWSEHSTGLAVDIASSKYPETRDLDPSTYDKSLASYLAKSAPNYGFKLSYPQGSTTGAGYEPWHFVFEGNSVYTNSKPISSYEDNSGGATSTNCVTASSNGAVAGSSDGFIHPMKGKGSVTNCYGQNSCSGHGGRFHKGVDISTGNGVKGAPIYAVADGKVIYSNNECLSGVDQVGNSCGGGYGNRTEIEHTVKGEKWRSASNHQYQGSVTVKAGDIVKQGQQIGIEGSSGSSSAQHIHFELQRRSEFVDPCTKFKC